MGNDADFIKREFLGEYCCMCHKKTDEHTPYERTLCVVRLAVMQYQAS